ncbi:MAG: succinyl-diaminopimelate desuccinylase [Methylophilales bacterium]|jgi:succinyl-diaminopimelate desuccinylase|nr:succinyl-diaminopimelate desuccinylase [Pseudomonadota bacterium]NQW34196.1 succinyl-diaminopimelate desuccinylase [Methylophilales bacterium]HCK04668.1 succinyl-diaminopimelate desuccinylase [Methylophilaceae bacterium]|tara:strand:- start:24426 stop:25556 length:1131 start_codon:yes stop_codon:yes gene_type:complete
MTRTLDIAKDLISKKSITPNDAGCQDLLIRHLNLLGFTIENMNYGDVRNFYAKRGTNSPLVVFAGHTDVVPTGPEDKWQSPPFTPTVTDNKLYGRGAADMKSSLAAFIVSIEEFVAANPNHPGSIALLITSDEEGVATDGTVKVIEALKNRKEQIDYCIVGEPTSNLEFGDTVKNGRRGSLSAKLIVEGIQGHIAYPELIKNPIHEIAPVIHDLVNTVWDEGNEYFPKTSWQISNINGGTGATNVVPGEVEVLFNFRYSTESSAESLKTRVEETLKKYQLNYKIYWNHSGQPYLTEKGLLVNKLSEAIEEVLKIKPVISTTGGTSDGRFIATLCDQVVEFGPINESIHKINEYVAVDDVDKLKNIYRITLEKILLT